MRALLQRVQFASVTVDGELISKTGKGLLILLGVAPTDSEKEADFLAEKCVNLRIFEDENGKMNRSLLDVHGDVLIVSQFTLYADCRHGRRPAFTDAAPPAHADKLYEYFMAQVKQKDIGEVGHGIFGADMKVELLNDGPVTIMLDTEEIMSKNK